VLVVLGGALGVALRAALLLPLGSASGALVLPLATLGVNVVGSLLLGVVVGWLDDRHPRWRTFLGTGVLGGFTTYSAFAVQAVEVGGSAPVVGLLLAPLAVFAGVLAAAVGLRVGRSIADVPGEVEPPETAE
jgi:CrcB protein